MALTAYGRAQTWAITPTLPALAVMIGAPEWFALGLGLAPTPAVALLLRLLGVMMLGIQVRTLIQARTEPVVDHRIRLRALTGVVLDALAAVVVALATVQGVLGVLGWGVALAFAGTALGFLPVLLTRPEVRHA